MTKVRRADFDQSSSLREEKNNECTHVMPNMHKLRAATAKSFVSEKASIQIENNALFLLLSLRLFRICPPLNIRGKLPY